MYQILPFLTKAHLIPAIIQVTQPQVLGLVFLFVLCVCGGGGGEGTRNNHHSFYLYWIAGFVQVAESKFFGVIKFCKEVRAANDFFVMYILVYSPGNAKAS